jgi:hypothetical protein
VPLVRPQGKSSVRRSPITGSNDEADPSQFAKDAQAFSPKMARFP